MWLMKTLGGNLADTHSTLTLIRVLYVQWHQTRMAGICVTLPKLAQKWRKTAVFRLFSFVSKIVHTIRGKISTVFLHHIRVLHVQWHQNRMTRM